MMKWLGRIALLLCLITVGTLLVAYLGFRASLPILEGNIQTSEISDNVLLERDGHGNATLTASNRLDLSYASGFLHAQERFFQMDLSRRLASGELSELFGSIALSTDRRNRLHRFRSRASVAIGLLPDHEQELLVKYKIAKTIIQGFEYQNDSLVKQTHHVNELDKYGNTTAFKTYNLNDSLFFIF